MRSNPVGRIVHHLLEAERKEKERREWVKTLFVPIGIDIFGYTRLVTGHKPPATQEKTIRSPNE